jgi:hypothetical protein
MGMYFNTAATRLLLKTLNERYDRSPQGLALNGPTDKPLYNNSAKTLVDIWDTFNVTLNIAPTSTDPGSPNGYNNFKRLIHAFEQNNNGSSTTADFIKSTMVSYLSDKNCNAIEFFAVPSSQILAYPSATVSDPDHKGKHSCIIAIETLTYDQTAAFVRHNQWVKPTSDK